MSLEMLKADKIFLKWYERSRSSLLILRGHNFVRDYGYDSESEYERSWLSYASAWLAEESIRKSGHTLSYFGHLKNTIRMQYRRSFWYVIKTFVYRLAQNLSDESVEKFGKIISEIDSTTCEEADNTDVIEQMVDILIALLKVQTEDNSLYVVINRLDQCQWERFKEKGIDDLGHTVRFLLQLVHHQGLEHLNIKILFIMKNQATQEVVKRQQ